MEKMWLFGRNDKNIIGDRDHNIFREGYKEALTATAAPGRIESRADAALQNSDQSLQLMENCLCQVDNSTLLQKALVCSIREIFLCCKTGGKFRILPEGEKEGRKGRKHGKRENLLKEVG